MINPSAPGADTVAGTERQLLRLRQFFSPIEYDTAGGPDQLTTVQALFDTYDGRAVGHQSSLFDLTNRHSTHLRAAEAIQTDLDPALRKVEDLLGAAAHGLAQQADSQPGVLFGSEPRIGRLAQHAAIERLLASWYFVKNRRLGPNSANKGDRDLYRELLIDVGNDLLARLPVEDPAYLEILADLALGNGDRI